MLMHLGVVAFELFPVNIHEYDQSTGADFAAKGNLGRRQALEFVGEGDETMTLTGRIFPERFGGLGGLGAIEMMKASGKAQGLMRGDGTILGWFVIDKLTRKSTELRIDGVARMIEFDVSLRRSSLPGPADYVAMVMGLMS